MGRKASTPLSQGPAGRGSRRPDRTGPGAARRAAAAHPRETLDCAEKIFGIDFTDEQEQQALNGVNRTWPTTNGCGAGDPARYRTGRHLSSLSAGQEAEARRHARREDQLTCSRRLADAAR